MSYTIHHGDCREVMATLEANSIDSIVTDPPYGLSFMGKGWDHGVPGVEFWTEALRVAKPGAHLLAFGGSRTYHRLACAIEDAGWEVRDCIMWIYGSGFPKSHDVSKAIDREAGAEREVVGYNENHRTLKPTNTICGQPHTGDGNITAPATDAAKKWAGWGSNLKPAFEPIIVARKPLVGTIAQNVLAYGTGGINIDGCRVGTEGETPKGSGNRNGRGNAYQLKDWIAPNGGNGGNVTPSAGRWPANVIHDGSDEVVAGFPQRKTGGPGITKENHTGYTMSGGGSHKTRETIGYNDEGSAARFFYTAKASKADRDAGCEGLEAKEKHTRNSYGNQSEYECPDGSNRVGNKGTSIARNHHPTVKPTDLMRYLCRLVTPPSGTVLDPFCGSGSTGKGAILEGFNFAGIEREAEYVAIAKARCDWASKQYQPTLFDL